MEGARFMELAARQAVEGVRQGRGGPFGAVVVRQGEVVGCGCNTVTSSNDPTAHAEVNAIRDACSRLGTFCLDDCSIYATCEPCPMCLSAILWARIPKLFHSCTREEAAVAGFDDAAIHDLVARNEGPERIRLVHKSAGEAMDEWKRKRDRIPY